MAEPASIAVVVGVAGGLGGALARTLGAQGRYDLVVGLARRRPADWPNSPEWPFIETDIQNEDDLLAAAQVLRALGSLDRVVVATGLLHGEGVAPEKTMRSLDAATLTRLFAVNAVAPALIAKHLLPLTPKDRPSVFAALSARVGSISDNRLGGWYGYRASKAALNMLIATLAIEHRRTRPLGVCVALHPGTVLTDLSAPFRKGGADDTSFIPARSAQALVELMDRLGADDNGGFFAWDGSRIEW
ncbi:SDR family NAD(P)-dependent oxidoreductase [Caulobacter sp.]|uniref:SDR family NAD(P)-dependent oxidoreductase n=1 Tax=Caulobacter sp. TaxID=78 RepID=UPI003BACA21D